MSPPLTRNRRIGVVHASLALLAIAVIGKAVNVQIAQGDEWAAAARRQHFSAREVPAPRPARLAASRAHGCRVPARCRTFSVQ